MPVVLTPVDEPGSGTIVDPFHHQAPVTRLFNIPQVAKAPGVTIRQGQCGAIQYTLRDYNGDPLDLSPYADAASYQVILAIRDSAYREQSQPALTEVGTVVSPADGLVEAPVPDDAANNAGIYFAEFVIKAFLDTDVGVATGCVIYSNVFYLLVDWGHQGTPRSGSRGPPTLAEIRLSLRDYPEANRLLDEYEFDVAEVAISAQSCVDWYNETDPPAPAVYTTQTFPWRYHWRMGILYHLFQIAAHWYRRNRFSYSAGGVSIDSLDKEKDYTAAAGFYQQQWEGWAKKNKVRANIDDGWQTLGSTYDGFAWGV